MSTTVKICGLTSPEGVAAAVSAGARYLGFVFFAKSPRHVTPEQAAALASEVPLGIAKVGLFVNPDDALLQTVLAQVPLVLRAELYAVAALVGALVVALGHWLALPALPCALVGAGLCFGLRMMAVTYGWHLPVALQSGGDGEPPGPLT